MKALIVAGGKPPSVELLERCWKASDLVIAADRGYDCLRAAGHRPDLLVGDFDSADPDSLEDARETEICRAPREKDETDLELAARIAVERGADKFCILGATGGRVDHLLGNLAVLLWLREQGGAARIEDDAQIIDAVLDEFAFQGFPGQTVSIVPAFAGATVSASGLYYPLRNLTLPADAARGISNVVTEGEVRIAVDAPVYIIRSKSPV